MTNHYDTPGVLPDVAHDNEVAAFAHAIHDMGQDAERKDKSLRTRMAIKLVVRELAVIENRTAPTGVLLRSVTEADTTADTVIAVFDLPLSPFGLRDAVRTFIAAGGPFPSATSVGERDRWMNTVCGEVAVTLAGG